MTNGSSDDAALLLFARADVGDIEGWFRLRGGRIGARGAGLDRLAGPLEGERVVLVLPGTDVSIEWLDLPALTQPQAIAAARLTLAERSLAGMDHLHIAVSAVHGARRLAATIDADLLGRWIGWAQEGGFDPDTIVPLPLLIAYGEGPPRLWIRHGIGNVRGHDQVFAVEADLVPVVLADVPAEPMDEDRFEAELPTALLALPLDLRQGRFMRRREWRVDAGWRRRMVRYAAAAAILLLLVPVTRLARIAYDDHGFRSEARRITRLALGRESLPDDPREALQQALAGIRGPGMGFSNMAALVFAGVRQTPNVELAGMIFDQTGAMTVTVTASSPADLAMLVERIGQSGMVVEAMPGAGRGSSVLRLHKP
jgi:general secretion pathway protein L